MQSAVSILRAEHASHAAVLKYLVSQIDRASAHLFMPSLDVFATGISYIETFVDHFHHPREDEFLFRALRRRTSEADTVLLALQFDHAHSTCTLAGLKSSLDNAKSGGGVPEFHQFADAMERHAQEQFAHMEQEENVVIPLARRFLMEDDWREIDRAFRSNRDPLFGASRVEHAASLLRGIPRNAD